MSKPLQEAIAAYNAAKKERIPSEVLTSMADATDSLKATGIETRALKAGDTMPDFVLPNQHGSPRRLQDYLANSAVILNIYRGCWCPYCNMEMKARCPPGDRGTWGDSDRHGSGDTGQGYGDGRTE